jgi:DNA-binding beta-propeller fold protein YncE
MCSNMFFHFVENGTSENDCIVNFSGRLGGIWGPAGAVFDPQTNKVYVATGNGLFDANTAGGHEWGDSVLALNPNGLAPEWACRSTAIRPQPMST